MILFQCMAVAVHLLCWWLCTHTHIPDCVVKSDVVVEASCDIEDVLGQITQHTNCLLMPLDLLLQLLLLLLLLLDEPSQVAGRRETVGTVILV